MLICYLGTLISIEKTEELILFMDGFLESLWAFIDAHLGELLTFTVSFCAIFTSWKCIKWGMRAEIEKALVLRKLDRMEDALAELAGALEIADALVLLINGGDIADENLEAVRVIAGAKFQELLRGFKTLDEKWRYVNIYFGFSVPSTMKEDVEKICVIERQTKNFDSVATLSTQQLETLRTSFKLLAEVIDSDASRWRKFYSDMMKVLLETKEFAPLFKGGKFATNRK